MTKRSEGDIQNRIRIAASELGWVTFRNTIGTGWVGTVVATFENGDIVLRNARRTSFGLVKGSGDLIGWKPEVIMPDMVGKEIARFLSIEVKTPSGRVEKEQKTWAKNVVDAGGYAIIARGEEDILDDR